MTRHYFALVLGLFSTLGLADDSATCEGKNTSVDFTVVSEGPNTLLINNKRVRIQRENWIQVEAKNSSRMLDEEVALTIDNGTSIKTEYRIENWRHCGNIEDVRVRIYDVSPGGGRVFVEEIACICQNS